MIRRQWRRSSVLKSLVVLAAICVPVAILFHLKSSNQDDATSSSISHRSLSSTNYDDQSIPEDNAILALLKAHDEAGPLSAPVPAAQVLSHTLDDIISSVIPTFEDVVGVVIYDPTTDKFILHYSKHMRWKGGCHKLVGGFRALTYSLRKMFPNRFENGQPELAIAISSGDYPEVKLGIPGRGLDFAAMKKDRNCFLGLSTPPCVPSNLPPVLQFGSAFKSPEIYPSMIAMPMPQYNHVACYQLYAVHQIICPRYLPSSPTNPKGLVFGETMGLGWNDLIPQVVWRGTDFGYLGRLYTRLRQPDFQLDIGSKLESISNQYNVKVAATQAMIDAYDQFIPRWKSVIWTAEAEREAEDIQKGLPNDSEEVVIPWANMKFAMAMNEGVKTSTSKIPYYQEFEEHGIPAIGEEMSLKTLARYKYHIDTGGGGGTTWSGTLEKLGLPGVLFHHETPMKDYLHEKMIKWVHYIPIKEDLSDLKEKFDWAESHPELAKQISDNATQLAKSLGTHEGFSIMFNEFFEQPLRAVVEAYQPSESGSADLLDTMITNDLRPIMQCSGYYSHYCEGLVGDITFSRYNKPNVIDFEPPQRKM